MSTFKELLPKQGYLHQAHTPSLVLCKPKIIPLRSLTLLKLDQLQKDAQEKLKELEREAAAAPMYTSMANSIRGLPPM